MSNVILEHLQVLSFILGDQFFGAEINQVQEVIEYRTITKVPNTPDYMIGVINLRGKVIPIVELRERFNIAIQPTTVDTCIIIIELLIDNEQTPIGIIADQVKEVLEVNIEDIEKAPKLGLTLDNKYLHGMVKMEEEILILLNLKKVFDLADLHQITDIESTNDDLE